MQTPESTGHLISRRRLIAGALVGASALLAACASVGPTARSTATPQSLATSTAAGTTAAAQPAQQAAPSGQATTIRLMAWGDPQEQKARQVTLAAFQQQYPAIRVNFLLTPTNDYLNKLNTMLASGDVPDVIFIGNGDMWRYAKLGSLLPLTPLIAREHFDTSDINQQVYQLYNVDGKQYGFPVDAPSQQLYHNVTAFQEAGQPLPSYDWKDTSWNWEAFAASAQKLVKRDASGHVTRYAFPVQTGFRAWWIWVRANGGTLFNAAGSQCLLNQPPAVEAFQFLSDLIHKYKVAPSVAENQTVGGFTSFLSGNLATVTMAPFLEETRLDFKGGTWDVAPHPAGKAGKACSGGGTGHHVAQVSKHPEQAWTFMKWVISKPAVTLWTQQMGIVPPLTSLESSDIFLQPGKPPAHVKVFTEGLSYLAADPRHPKFTEVIQAVSKNLDDVWNASKSTQVALDSAVRDANAVIAAK
jgi:multiple sugar transport system substrate-binding protein